MRRLPLLPRVAFAVLVLFVLLLPLEARNAQQTRSMGQLGNKVRYTLEGDVGEIWLHLPSFQTGPIPLAVIDATDPRSIGVGLDLFAYSKSGVFAGSTAIVNYKLPSSPSLAGLALRGLFLTFPGVTTIVDEISNRSDVVLAAPGTMHNALSQSLAARQGHTVTAVQGIGSAAIDGVIVVGGDEPDGLGGLTALDTIEIFDPQTQTSFASVNTLQHARSTHTATLLLDGRVLILGGYDVTEAVRNTGEIYDPATDSTSTVAPMADARTQHTATLMADGRVFVSGRSSLFDLDDVLGSLANTHASCEIYDPGSNTWTTDTPDLPLGGADGLAGHTASLLGNGQVLVVGGAKVTLLPPFNLPIPAVSSNAYRYDPGSNAWVATPSMPIPRAYHGQISLSNGTALVVGGADGTFVPLAFSTLSACHVYDAASGWSTVGSLTDARAYPVLLRDGDDVLTTGGLLDVDVTTGSGTPAQRIELTSGAIGSWTLGPTMLLPREVARAAFVDGGERVVIVGTGDNGVAAVDRTCEVYVR